VQANIADPAKYPKFLGNVSNVDTRPFHSPDTSPEVGIPIIGITMAKIVLRTVESMGAEII
jgi:hypothetical protein